MTFAKCLNLPCRIFKQFAYFSDAFKSFFFNSVKYFISQSHVDFFFRCLNCVPAPSYSVLFWLSFFSQHFFQLFVHVTSVWFFWSTCGYILPLNCFLIHTINIFKSFWKFPKIILGIKKIHSYNLNNFINIKHRTLKYISE